MTRALGTSMRSPRKLALVLLSADSGSDVPLFAQIVSHARAPPSMRV
jgi:hypothetical protein